MRTILEGIQNLASPCGNVKQWTSCGVVTSQHLLCNTLSPFDNMSISVHDSIFYIKDSDNMEIS